MKRRLKQMQSAWTEKEMEILKEAYPIKESQIDNRLLDREKELVSTSGKAEMNGKLNYDANGNMKVHKD